MNYESIYSSLENHVRSFFSGHTISDFVWRPGLIEQTLPRFRVMQIAPGSKSSLWTYVSIGAWEAGNESKIEFILCAPEENSRFVELLAMTTYYHCKHTLGLGHTFPIGEAWVEGSICDYMLVSLPYPFGDELEVCNTENDHIHLFWLLPITEQERRFKVENGLEALEEKFEEKELKYWQVGRKSVV